MTTSTGQDTADHRDSAEDARVAALVRSWARDIADAIASANRAAAILGELQNCDDELFESAAASDAREALATAQRHLWNASGIAAGRLKLVEQAERDAEIVRLRERNTELERLLAATTAKEN